MNGYLTDAPLRITVQHIGSVEGRQTVFVYRLAEIVRDHSIRAEVRDGALWAEAVYSLRDGSVVREWEQLAPTLGATMDWLGY